MKRVGNPWIDRFDPDISDNVLRARIRSQNKQLDDLAQMPITVAVENLRQALGQIFVPTAKHCEILRRLLGAARAYAQKYYSGIPEYQRTIYLEHIPIHETAPICLTSLSGVGKSTLLRAFCRLCERQTIDIPNHQGIVLDPCWMLTAEERSSIRKLFRTHVESFESRNGGPGSTTEDAIRKALYRDGVGLLVLDELQFLAKSSSTLPSNILMSLMRLGPPVVYASNFSLLNRFGKRPQEERRRLLSEIIVLQTDDRTSLDWLETFRAMLNVAKEFSGLDPKMDGQFVYEHSFGIKGYAAKLLLLAYVTARRSGSAAVSAMHIEKASRSSDFALEREDVHALEQLALGTGLVKGRNGSPRHDLQCPFQTGPVSSVIEAKNVVEEHKTRVSQRALESTFTENERKESKPANSSPTTARVVPIRRQLKADKGNLLAGAKNFREMSTRPKPR